MITNFYHTFAAKLWSNLLPLINHFQPQYVIYPFAWIALFLRIWFFNSASSSVLVFSFSVPQYLSLFDCSVINERTSILFKTCDPQTLVWPCGNKIMQCYRACHLLAIPGTMIFVTCHVAKSLQFISITHSRIVWSTGDRSLNKLH